MIPEDVASNFEGSTVHDWYAGLALHAILNNTATHWLDSWEHRQKVTEMASELGWMMMPNVTVPNPETE